MTEFFYRVFESRYTEKNGYKDIFVSAYPVIKTTPKGVWLNLGKWDAEPVLREHQKFVLRDNGKFAQPTVDMAIKMFRYRKKIHIQMMKFRLDVIEAVARRATAEDFTPCNIEEVRALVAEAGGKI